MILAAFSIKGFDCIYDSYFLNPYTHNQDKATTRVAGILANPIELVGRGSYCFNRGRLVPCAFGAPPTHS